jgi:integrase
LRLYRRAYPDGNPRQLTSGAPGTLYGLEHRTHYSLRHTYATFAIALGVTLFEIARFMGTSVSQIDATYGHLLPAALDRTRAALDAFVARGEQESVSR